MLYLSRLAAVFYTYRGSLRQEMGNFPRTQLAQAVAGLDNLEGGCPL